MKGSAVCGRECSSETLTADERAFLLAGSGLREEDLTSEAREASRIAIARDRAAAEAAVVATSLTTRQVAILLGRAPVDVRRLRTKGGLYAPLGGGKGVPLLFPRWQFTVDGRVLPGLREVVTAFPRYMHPLSIERFMTSGHEGLGGQDPASWLAAGKPIATVAELADELGYD